MLKLYLPTLKEEPSEAEIIEAKLRSSNKDYRLSPFFIYCCKKGRCRNIEIFSQ